MEGILGRKLGMTQIFQPDGTAVPVTVIAVEPNRVTQLKSVEKDGYRALIPMDRWGVPDDVGGAVVYLASDAASFVTAQNIHVNGGMTVH